MKFVDDDDDYDESYTKYKNRKKRDRQTDRMQSARGLIIHNVRKVTDGERIRQA